MFDYLIVGAVTHGDLPQCRTNATEEQKSSGPKVCDPASHPA